MNGLRYLLAHGLLCLVGAPIALAPRLRPWSVGGKAAAAFAMGAVVLTIEATVLGLFGLNADPVLVMCPLAAIGTLLWARMGVADGRFPLPFSLSAKVAAAIAGLSVSLFALSLVVGHATSTDFLLFWGVKAVRFADLRGIASELLAWPYFRHARPFYPPLVPVVGAWAAAAAGQMPWRVAPLATLIWFSASALFVWNALRGQIQRDQALIVTSFWTTALGASLAASYSGGSAEAPLLLFTTAAGSLLAVEKPGVTITDRGLAGLFLAGAVLTKVEGSVAAALLIASVGFRDLINRGSRLSRSVALALPPLIAGVLWLLFLLRYRIPIALTGPGIGLSFRGDFLTVLRELGRNLSAGTYWLSWAVPLFALCISLNPRLNDQILPLLVPAVGLLLFLVGLYWHEGGDLVQRMRWEVPRVSQTSLSFTILAAGLASGSSTLNSISTSSPVGRNKL